MAISGRYFPGQAPTERIFLVLRRSIITYIAFLAIAAIMMIPLIILAVVFIRFPDVFSSELVNSLITLAGSAYLLFIIALLLYGFVDFYLDVYIITDERIVDIRQAGFFKRQIAELHLREVQDVSAAVDGFFATFFHYGDVHIQTAGERENFIFYSVPHPYRVAKKIADLHESQVERDRLISEQNIEQQVINRIQSPETGSNLADPRFTKDLPLATLNTPQNKAVNTNVDYQDRIDETEPQFETYRETLSQDQAGQHSDNNSSRGIPDDEGDEIQVDRLTNVQDGLDKIDQYLAETENQKVADSIELKEGQVDKINED